MGQQRHPRGWWPVIRHNHLRRPALLAGLMLALAAGLGTCWLTWWEAWGAAERDLARAAKTAAATAGRILEGQRLAADLVDEMVRGLSDEDLRDREAEQHARLTTLVHRLRLIRGALVVDHLGVPLLSSHELPVPRVPAYAHEEWFRALATAQAPPLHVGAAQLEPELSEVSFPISRQRSGPVDIPDRSFTGIIKVAADPNSFAAAFAALLGDRRDTLSLLRSDGRLVVRTPRPANPPAAHPAWITVQHPELGPATHGVALGRVVPPGGLREQDHVVAFHQIDGLPLYVTAARARTDIAAAWRRLVLPRLAFGVLVVGMLALLARLTLRPSHAGVELLDSRPDAAKAAQAMPCDPIAAITPATATLAAPFADPQLADAAHHSGRPNIHLIVVNRADRVAGLTARPTLTTARDDSGSSRSSVRPCPQASTVPLPQLVSPPADTTAASAPGAGDAADRGPWQQRATGIDSHSASPGDAPAWTRADLAHTQRLEALGRIAGGVAHDYNNVLQVVLGAAHLIGEAADSSDRVRRLAAMISNAAGRGAAITRRVLSIARHVEPRVETVDVAGFVAEMREVFVHTLGAGVDVEVDVAPGLPDIFVDRRQLETVLLNLAANARDAMSGNGTMTLSARAATTADGLEGAAAAAKPAPRGHVCITVSDTGAGMDAATLARASEPFFTTKPAGLGTGLGLAMARSFVEQSGGLLRLESRPGEGTSVRLWLPCAEPVGDVTPPQSSSAAAGASATLRPRILLADDEAPVRDLLAEGLEEQGCRVVRAASGAEALDILMGDTPLDLMVADVGLRGIDGLTLIRRSRTVRPDLPALLLTGHAVETAALAVGAHVSVLRKPIEVEVLAAQVSALLVGTATDTATPACLAVD